MATPRKYLVDPNVPLFYHLVSRCVHRAYLCGFDPLTGKDYSHRKQWLIDRLNFLVQFFAVDLYGYAIMDNHFHLAVFHDPKTHLRWSREEVADRWLAVSPPRSWGGKPVSPEKLAEAKADLLNDRKRLTHVRKQLGSLSTFMKFLKQDIARRANLEDGVTGHFFEQRFWSGALLSERAILSTMAYIDLNPVRAEIVKTIEEIELAGITDRLAAAGSDAASLEDYLKPLRGGLPDAPPRLSMTLQAYIDLLRSVIAAESPESDSPQVQHWRRDIATIRKRQRAYGSKKAITDFAKDRNWKRLPDSLDG
jgi:REP element-mobilizing transposase RayT